MRSKNQSLIESSANRYSSTGGRGPTEKEDKGGALAFYQEKAAQASRVSDKQPIREIITPVATQIGGADGFLLA